jgi:hypothetical protein
MLGKTYLTVILVVIVLTIVMLNVVMLGVVAPILHFDADCNCQGCLEIIGSLLTFIEQI